MLPKNLYTLDKEGKKGDWCFINKNTKIALLYGDNTFIEMIILPISSTGSEVPPVWCWDGNKESPTITPSILIRETPGWNKGWHGFLTDGKLVEV